MVTEIMGTDGKTGDDGTVPNFLYSVTRKRPVYP